MQVVNITYLPDEAFLVQGIYRFIAKAVNVHSLAANKVLHFPDDLRRAAFIIRAIKGGFTFLALKQCAAGRAVRNIAYCRCAGHTLSHIYTDDLGDDLAALFYINPVVLMQFQAYLYLIGIVQGGPFYGCAGKQNRFQVGNRCYRAGAAHLVAYAQQFGLYLLGLIFISNSPARRLGRETQFLLLRIVVYLYYYTINIIA